MEAIDTSFSHSYNQSTIYCFCGTTFNAGLAQTNICVKCLSPQTDITAGITKQMILNCCGQCKRYLGPPWVSCEIGTKEMLSLCLNRIKGFNKVQVLDASFLWTKPQSNRIRVKLSVQKEIFDEVTVIQTFPVEFNVHYQQCEDCQKLFSGDEWGALVQIKQNAINNKTFYLLEQLILKHEAHAKVLKIRETGDGLDFYFKSKSHAERFVDFVQTIFSIKLKLSKQLIHQNDPNSTFSYKYTFLAELPKVCEEDLVVLSQKLRGLLQGCNPVLICKEVALTIRLIDPFTLEEIQLSGARYFQYEEEMAFFSLRNYGTEYTISNIGLPDLKSTNQMATDKQTAKISVVQNADKKIFEVSSQLREKVKVGDVVVGFDLSAISANGGLENNKNLQNLPEVILVRPAYSESKNKKRIWTLKRLLKEKHASHHKKSQNLNDSFEEFLNEIEENPKIRAKMNLFRDEKAIRSLDMKNLEAHPSEKKKVKVKGAKNLFNNKDMGEKGIVEVEKIQGNSQQENDNTGSMIKLEELLSDLTLNDPETSQQDLLDKEIISEFISKLGKIKIEK